MTGPDVLLRRYIECRDEIARLTHERAALFCDFEEISEFGETIRKPLRARTMHAEAGEFTEGKRRDYALTAPCWRIVNVDVDDGQTGAIGDWSEEGWCEPCRRRALVHEQLRAALRARGPRLTAIITNGRARLGMPRFVAPKAQVSEPPKPEPERFINMHDYPF